MSLFLPKAVDKARQRRSQLARILNVPRGYASGSCSPAALLDGLSEQPTSDFEREKEVSSIKLRRSAYMDMFIS